MIISTHWLRHALREHPDALAALALDTMSPLRGIRPGDSVVCTDMGDTGGDLERGREYAVSDAAAWWVTLREFPGTRFDACRFSHTQLAADPVTDLLAAIDRGSWAEVLEARKAFE